MAPSISDIRHTLLVSLIVAAVPMLFFPNMLELTFELNVIWYMMLELVYFFVLASFLNRSKSMTSAGISAALFLVGRGCLSCLFIFLLFVFEKLAFPEAFQYAFNTYKPALLLFTIATPFLFNSTAQPFAEAGRPKARKKRMTDPQIIRGDQPTTFNSYKPANRSAATAAPRTTNEFFDRTFDDAVKHVGGYSGVICSILIDDEGLPLAIWHRSENDGEAWSALAKRIVDDVEDINQRTGLPRLEMLEFRTGGQRFYLYRVFNLWLLSIAAADSDELEKIRVHQAAEMVMRHCQEKFKNIYTTETGRTYAGSAV